MVQVVRSSIEQRELSRKRSRSCLTNRIWRFSDNARATQRLHVFKSLWCRYLFRACSFAKGLYFVSRLRGVRFCTSEISDVIAFCFVLSWVRGGIGNCSGCVGWSLLVWTTFLDVQLFFRSSGNLHSTCLSGFRVRVKVEQSLLNKLQLQKSQLSDKTLHS